MASTSNAENLVKVARNIYQLCDYTDFKAVFLELETSACFPIPSHILYHYRSTVQTYQLGLIITAMLDLLFSPMLQLSTASP